MSTFINDPLDKINKLSIQRQPQQPQPPAQQKPAIPTQPPGTIAVGFWADAQNVKRYREYANRLYNQIITDESGNKKRMLEHNDINEFVWLATEYFIQTIEYTAKFSESGNFKALVKMLAKQMGFQ